MLIVVPNMYNDTAKNLEWSYESEGYEEKI